MAENTGLLIAFYRGLLVFLSAIFVYVTSVYSDPVVNALLMGFVAVVLKLLKDLITAYLEAIEKENLKFSFKD